MRLLVDSHVLLWWFRGALKPDVLTMLRTEPDTFVSAASVWEIAVKQALGKFEAPADLAEAVAEGGFQELPVTFRHAAAVRELPPHHRDPFDRMLIAQARVEDLTVVTRDKVFSEYDVSVLPA